MLKVTLLGPASSLGRRNLKTQLLFLHFGLPSTPIRHKNETFRNALRTGGFTCVSMWTGKDLENKPQFTMAGVIVAFSNCSKSVVVWTENIDIWCILESKHRFQIFFSVVGWTKFIKCIFVLYFFFFFVYKIVFIIKAGKKTQIKWARCYKSSKSCFYTVTVNSDSMVKSGLHGLVHVKVMTNTSWIAYGVNNLLKYGLLKTKSTFRHSVL